MYLEGGGGGDADSRLTPRRGGGGVLESERPLRRGGGVEEDVFGEEVNLI